MTLPLVLSLLPWLTEGTPPGGSPADWFFSTVPAGALLNGLGLGVLAFLFARDLVLTRGQHTRRVADIVAAHDKEITTKDAAHAEIVRIMGDSHTAAIAEQTTHHAALIAEKDKAYADMRERMAYYRDARLIEQERNNKLTDQLVEYGELAKVSAHVLQAIDQAAKDVTP